jgi:predicted nucleotidyltransferase component of viral defense system
MIKIETNYIKRGTLYPVEYGQLCQTINTVFKRGLTNIPVLAVPELYAGKLCAALSRQHPRDLFDVKLLLESTGLTDTIRQAFVAYLVCDARPIHEVLAPRFKVIQKPYEREFKRMTAELVSADALVATAKSLVKKIQHDLTNPERKFLLSVKQGEPDYTLLPFEHLSSLPGVQWKLMNIHRMDKNKHHLMLSKLKDVLAM